MTSADAAPEDDDLLRDARQLAPALYTLSRVLRLRGVAEAGLPPLPPSDLELLRYVLDNPGTGTGAAAREIGLHASNVSTGVRGLVAFGLLRREADPHDRRAVQLYPTMDAQHGMAQIENAWAEIFADVLALLPVHQRAALNDAAPALRALGAALRQSHPTTSD
ncbi:MarR family winged helix-turn-helix transcriptional regulator [Streptomyces sp. 147326]|uniref:MarR family winged helix-turn-helix transcriptional regulator n=1 Tax=Streptomyces sp. 147326 TaxID=3074379 RepID=UPI0038572CF3